MISLQNQIEIDRPVTDVFQFVAHVENAPKWQPAVIETSRITEGPMRVGTQYREVAKMMGRRVTTVCEITELVPDRRIAWKATSSGPFSYQTTYTFTPAGSRTRLDIVGTFSLRGLWRLIEPVV
ncbi:MAG TPA: SRPBCC family protein, partial [Gemmatimonadaceae bacterium]